MAPESSLLLLLLLRLLLQRRRVDIFCSGQFAVVSSGYFSESLVIAPASAAAAKARRQLLAYDSTLTVANLD